MGLFDRLFGSHRIKDVVVFATDLTGIRDKMKPGGTMLRVLPKELILRADAELGLDGTLVSYTKRQSGDRLQVEEVPDMDASKWAEFLSRRFPGQRINVWAAATTLTRYAVVVIYETD
jgi:hypothetical protein